jgi:hypothetical protein
MMNGKAASVRTRNTPGTNFHVYAGVEFPQVFKGVSFFLKRIIRIGIPQATSPMCYNFNGASFQGLMLRAFD